ncbi:ABC transporter ATP-binding protein/permease [Alphaproteobacteria bacterium]|nr:ABC transporter ATP-binding protein/permease [Alphaproteobacteria bacterium]
MKNEMQIVTSVVKTLNPGQKKHLVLMLFGSLWVLLMDVISLASITPFVSKVSGVELADGIVSRFIAVFPSTSIMIMSFIALVMMAFTSRLLLRLYIQWITRHLGRQVSTQIFEKVLNNKLSWFYRTNIDGLQRTILTEADYFIGVAIAAMEVIVHAVSFVVIFVTLLVAVGRPALALAGAVLFVMLTVYLLSRRMIILRGNERFIINETRFTIVSGSLRSIKQLMVFAAQKPTTEAFDKSNKIYARAQFIIAAIKEVPRFAIEVLAILIIVTSFLYAQSRSLDVTEYLPVLGVIVFATYRLMPSGQALFVNFSKISAARTVVDNVHKILTVKSEKNVKVSSISHFKFDETIKLKNVNFVYTKQNGHALNNINVTFKRGEICGIVGRSGAGKSTMVDAILGLIEIDSGEILIDEVALCSSNKSAYQAKIGYVPQDIFILNGTIAENIMFGSEKKVADESVLKQVIKTASLEEFFEATGLNLGSMVINNGIGISGGQRQRIALARGLLRAKNLLILDEATNSLDKNTEKEVFMAIKKHFPHLTTLIVTHNPEVLDYCDSVIVLEKGCVVAEGSPKKVKKSDGYARVFNG